MRATTCRATMPANVDLARAATFADATLAVALRLLEAD